jgi:puromycin-sensitive aminopeptidase
MAKVAHLLDQIIPSHYTLHLRFGQQDTRFEAEEVVVFELKRASKQLVWHGVDLEIGRVEVEGHKATVSADRDAQTVTLAFEEELAAGEHELKLTFKGPIQDSLHGFYRASYQLEGREEWLVMTQFEAIHAREAFVCVDEPAAKAVFEVSLTVDEGLTVLGNTPVAEDQVVGGRRRVKFAPTPKMSTYLLAWIVSKLAHAEGEAASGVKIRVYATPQYEKQLDYAVEFARRSLDFYEDYFAIPYPLPKLDLVAVPNFASGAMENWGLITYRETDLLVDSTNTSLANKQRVSEVVAHEVAHQWFGNLVTMSWWDDLWLNESFASWAETTTVDHLEPSWEWWAHFRAGLGSYAREIDALANTHPIQVEVADPKALDEIFDAISYFKGQSILRMLEGYLGSEVFRDGLQIYLKRHAHGNTVTDDLWRALGEASGKDVAALMHAWTALPGYPVLSYEEGEAQQDRFVASARESKRLAESDEATAQVWPVPFAARLADGTVTEPLLMTEKQTELPEAVVASDWFKPNPEERGFYRSLYTDGMVAALRKALHDGALGTTDRYSVVSDVWAAVGAGRGSIHAALELTVAMRDETDYLPALAVYDSLGEMLAMVEDEALREQLEVFGRWLVEPNYARLGWEAKGGERHFDTLLRPVVLSQALRFEVSGAKEEALKRFADYVGGGALDPDTRSAVLYGTARYGNTEQYDQMLELYRHEEAPHTRQAQLVSLGRFRQPELAQRTLDLAMSDEVRSQDMVYGLVGVWRARENRELAWAHLQEQWEELVRRFGEGGHMLDRFPDFAGAAFATHERAQEVKAFFEAHPHILITRPAAQAVETIESKADWYDRDHETIAAFMEEWAGKQR